MRLFLPGCASPISALARLAASAPSCARGHGCKLSHGLVVGSFQPRPREEGVAVRVAVKVVLIFGLGLPEKARLADLGHDLAGPDACGAEVGDRVRGDLALLVGRIEDLRAVAGADDVFAK